LIPPSTAVLPAIEVSTAAMTAAPNPQCAEKVVDASPKKIPKADVRSLALSAALSEQAPILLSMAVVKPEVTLVKTVTLKPPPMLPPTLPEPPILPPTLPEPPMLPDPPRPMRM
jgi:hypothetical protein